MKEVVAVHALKSTIIKFKILQLNKNILFSIISFFIAQIFVLGYIFR